MPRLLLPLLITLITLPLGCKKYPDDDYWITLRSPKNRIKGIKRMVKAYNPTEQIDILALYRERFGAFYLDFTDEKAEGTGGYFVYAIDSITNQQICTGYWRFGRDEINTDRFYLVMNDNFVEGACHFPISDTAADHMNFGGSIEKCTKDELVIPIANFVSYEP